MRRAWFKHGFWNTLEHAITRGADALSSMVILWAVSPETFAKLASSQAIIAPILFMFIAPETIIYRDYMKWQSEGPAIISAKLRAFRLFAWGKAQFALVVSAALAAFSAGAWSSRFWPMVWAFSLVLAPQLSGPDREYLRLDLQLRTLNAISLFQKLSLLVGTCIAAVLYPGRMDYLACVAVFSAVSTALIASRIVDQNLKQDGAVQASCRVLPTPLETLMDAFTRFSIWQHLIGVILGWVQTMDLFMLAMFRAPGREVGLYAAVLKIANFSTMLPLALGNFFSVWVGRDIKVDLVAEKSRVIRLTGFLALGVFFQALVIYFISPYLFRLLSHGKWSSADLNLMMNWMKWILSGAALFSAGYLATCWLILRSNMPKLFLHVFLPWGALSFAIYAAFIRRNLNDPFIFAANANVWASVGYLFLMAFFFIKPAIDRRDVA